MSFLLDRLPYPDPVSSSVWGPGIPKNSRSLEVNHLVRNGYLKTALSCKLNYDSI